SALMTDEATIHDGEFATAQSGPSRTATTVPRIPAPIRNRIGSSSERKDPGHEQHGSKERDAGERHTDAYEIEEPVVAGADYQGVHGGGHRRHERRRSRERDRHCEWIRRSAGFGGHRERDGRHQHGRRGVRY